jgi:hypothetical protein
MPRDAYKDPDPGAVELLNLYIEYRFYIWVRDLIIRYFSFEFLPISVDRILCEIPLVAKRAVIESG